MAKKVKQKKAGRPEANIDWNIVAKYLRAQCDSTGIASLLGISPDTLYRRCKIDNKMDYTAFSAQKKSEGKEMLRMVQFTTAFGDREKGIPPSTTMQIWLGKQHLNQRDKNELTGADGKDLGAPMFIFQDISGKVIEK